jgi:hypothetical protein
MNVVKLTAPNGEPVWIAPVWVQTVKRPHLGQVDKNANSVLTLSGEIQAVKEQPEDVVRILQALINV